MSFYEKMKIVFSSVFTMLLPFVKQFLSSYGPILLGAAKAAVAVYAAQQLSSLEKREGAYGVIVHDLQAQGITIASSVVYSAIEAAYAEYKECIDG